MTRWSYGSSYAVPAAATARTTCRSTSTSSTVASTNRARRSAARIGCAQCRSSNRPEHASNRSGVMTKKFSRLTSVISTSGWPRNARSRWRAAATPPNPPPSTTTRTVSLPVQTSAWAGVISLGEGMVQDGPQFGDLPLRYLGGQDRLRSVKRPAPLVEFDRHASLHQPLRVDHRFIAVRIELRGRDVGGRQTRQIARSRGSRVWRGGRRGGTMAPRGRGPVARHEGRIGDRPRRPRLLPIIELGLIEQLKADRRPPLVTRAQRHRRREPRAGSMTADGEVLRVDA